MTQQQPSTPLPADGDHEAVDPTPQPVDDAAEPTRRRRLVVGVAGVGVVAALAAGWLIAGSSGGADFCDQVAALPSLSSGLDASGSPADGLREYADQMRAVAAAAPDDTSAGAATGLASYFERVAAAVSSDETVAVGESLAVTEVVGDGDDVDGLRDTLDAAIAKHCDASD